MNSRHLILAFVGASVFQGCRTANVTSSSEMLESKRTSGKSSIFFDNSREFDVTDYKGQTYLSFMKNTIKPAIDRLVDEQYEVGGADAMQKAYDNSDKKVQFKVDKMIGLETLKKVAENLKGQKVDATTLPALLMKDPNVPKGSAYNLASFIGLASGGGIAIKYADKNYSYNIHYDKTEQKSGRSYGTGPKRGANDASDKQYLDDLQSVVTSEDFSVDAFYGSMLGVLLDLDNTGYENNSDEAQGVLTDFLAVYTAEQARNLMDGKVTLHWDAALLEVTLLASFHGAQIKSSDENGLYLYFRDPAARFAKFTNKVLDQTPCAEPTKSRNAKMRDYWQFSKRIDDAKNCKRSGINVTKSEFRLLEEKITQFMAKSQSYKNLAKVIPVQKNNVYMSLSNFLINESAKEKYSSEVVSNVKSAWVAFLKDVNKNAPAITKSLMNQSGGAVDTSNEALADMEGKEDFIGMENLELGFE